MEKIKDILDKFGVKNIATPEDLFDFFCEMEKQENNKVLNKLIFPGTPLVSLFEQNKNNTILHKVVTGDLRETELVDKLIYCGANVNAQNSQGETPLHIALNTIGDIFLTQKPHEFLKESEIIKNIQILKILIKNKAKIHIRDWFDRSALHIALSLGDLQIMEILLENSKFPNIDKQGDRHYARFKKTARCRHLIEYLLNEVEKCIIPTFNYSSLLEFIARQKSDQFDDLFVHVLKNTISMFNVNAHSPISLERDTLLHIVSEHGTPGMIGALIAAGANTNICNKGSVKQTPIFNTITHNKPKNLKMLLENGANVNPIEEIDEYYTMEGNTPLHYAVNFGNFKMVQILVEKGADVNALSLDCSPLQVACFSSSNWPMIRTKLKSIKGMNTPYVYDDKIIEFLLDNGVDIEAENLREITALDESCRYGNLNIVKLLLNRGAKINNRGCTTLHHAITGKNLDIVKMILEKGAEVNYACARTGGTPLLYAIKKHDFDCAEIVKILLTYKADVNIPDEKMNSPLHLACLPDHRFQYLIEKSRFKAAIITELLNSNADINAYNKYGWTPFRVVYGTYLTIEDLMRDADINDSDNPYKLDLEIVVSHLIEMISRKEYVCEQNLSLLEDEEITRISEKFQDEINRMNEEKVINSYHISYLDILSMDINLLGRFLRNDSVMEGLNNLSIRFPYYGVKLEKKIQEAQQRQSLTDLVVNLFSENMKVALPFELIMQILSHLSIEDFNNFAETCFVKVDK